MNDVSNAGSGNPFEDLMKHIITNGLGNSAGGPTTDSSAEAKASTAKSESSAKDAAASGKSDAKAQTDQSAAAGPAMILPGALTSNIVTQGQPAPVTPALSTQGGKPQVGLFDIMKLMQTTDGGVANANVAPQPGVPVPGQAPQDQRHSGGHNIMQMLSSLMGGGGEAAGASGAAAGASGGAAGIMKMLAAFL